MLFVGCEIALKMISQELPTVKFATLAVVVVCFSVSLWVCIGYVAYHFISKFW